MGAHLTRRYLGDAETEPDPLQMPTFPPQLGLPERRPRGQYQGRGRAHGWETRAERGEGGRPLHTTQPHRGDAEGDSHDIAQAPALPHRTLFGVALEVSPRVRPLE